MGVLPMGKKAELEALRLELAETQETLDQLSENMAKMVETVSRLSRTSEDLRSRIHDALVKHGKR